MKKIKWKTVAPGAPYHLAALHLSDRGRCMPHKHDYAEVFWISEGELVHELNGEESVLGLGSIVTIRPEDFHGFRCRKKTGGTVVNLAFPAETLDFLGERYFPDQPEFWGHDAKTPCRNMTADAFAWIESGSVLLSQKRPTRLALESFLLNLLSLIADRHDDAEIATTRLPGWLANLCQIIREPEYFEEGPRVFSRLSGRTQEHVARELKKHTGKTPTQLLNNARLDHAAVRLRMSDESVMAISLDCGFTNLSHFYTQFKQRFDCPPRRYRIHNRQVLP